VIAVLIQWEEDDLDVQPDLDRLQTIFDTCYGFYTETWVIPSASSHSKLMEMAKNFVDDYGSPDNLLIVYYSGHAVVNSSRESTWFWYVGYTFLVWKHGDRWLSLFSFYISTHPFSIYSLIIKSTQDPLSPTVRWSAAQILFEEAKSDVLFLLDCCAAAGTGTGAVQGVNETISACGLETIPSGPGRHLFTNALIGVLDDWTSRPLFSAAMLHSEVLATIKPDLPEKGRWTDNQTVEKGRTPVYILSGDTKSPSIELSRRRGYDNPGRASANFSRPAPSPVSAAPTPIYSRFDVYHPANINKTLKSGELQIPHVLISVALEEDQTLDVEAWYAWLREIPALATYAVVEGVYKSFSTTLLISIPLLIWDMLPDDLAVSFVAYVQSRNLLAAESVEDFQRLAGTRQVVKARESKQLAAKIAQSTPTKTGSRPSSKSEIPQSTPVKPHPLSIVDPPQVTDVRRHSISKVDPPQLIDIPPHPLSTVDRLQLSDLQLPQQLAKPDATQHVEMKPSPDTKPTPDTEPKRSRPTLASFMPSEKKMNPLAMNKVELPSKPSLDPPASKPEPSISEKQIKELIQSAQLAREEAARAWEELGRREKEDRVRLSALRAGQSVSINGIQVSPTSVPQTPERNSKAEAVLGTVITSLNSTPAPQRARASLDEPRPVPQRARASLEERRPLVFDAGVWRGIDNSRPVKKGLSFIDHKAKKLYSPSPPILPPPVVPTSKFTPLPFEPTLLRREPDPEVLRHMMSFQSSAGPSPPRTPEKEEVMEDPVVVGEMGGVKIGGKEKEEVVDGGEKVERKIGGKQGIWTFLDDEDEGVVKGGKVGERRVVRGKGSKLVKKRRDPESRSRGRKREGSVTRWLGGRQDEV